MGKKKPLMRNIGEFFGHIVKGIRTRPARTVVSKTEEKRVSEDGKMILRRTTIDEIEIRKDSSSTGPDEDVKPGS